MLRALSVGDDVGMEMETVLPLLGGSGIVGLVGAIIGAVVGAVIAEKYQAQRADHERLNAIRLAQFEQVRDLAVAVQLEHRQLQPLVDTYYKSLHPHSTLDPYDALKKHIEFFERVRAGVATARYSIIDQAVNFTLNLVIEKVDEFDKIYDQMNVAIGEYHGFGAAEAEAAEIDRELPSFTKLTDQAVAYARIWLFESTFETGDGSLTYASRRQRARRWVNRLLTRTYGGSGLVR